MSGVCLIVVATGRYREFVPQLLAGARRHVVGLDRIFVLADQRVGGERVVWLPWGHLAWPYPTLLRYRAFTAYRDVLRTAGVLLYVDVDMRFVGEVDLTQVDGLVAVQHPGYPQAAPNDRPYERNPRSRAHVPAGAGAAYFAGGVQGGLAETYLDAVGEMAGWVQDDLDAGLMPVWHDESVWNAWCWQHPPATVLPPAYCTPEPEEAPDTRVLALVKEHDLFRETPRSQRIRRRVTQRLARVLHPARRLLRPNRP